MGITLQGIGLVPQNSQGGPITVQAIATKSPTLEYLGESDQSVSLTTFTFSSFSLGAATSDRMIVVCYFGFFPTPAAAPTVTVGGVSATSVTSASILNYRSGIAWAIVPTGTTGDIVVTWGGVEAQCGIAVYSVKNYNSSTPYSSGTATGISPTANVNTKSNGVVIAVSQADSGSSHSFSYVTENYDGGAANGFGAGSVISAATTTSQAVTDTGPNTALVVASWR